MKKLLFEILFANLAAILGMFFMSYFIDMPTKPVFFLTFFAVNSTLRLAIHFFKNGFSFSS